MSDKELEAMKWLRRENRQGPAYECYRHTEVLIAMIAALEAELSGVRSMLDRICDEALSGRVSMNLIEEAAAMLAGLPPQNPPLSDRGWRPNVRCTKCGKTATENRFKYCGDGSDKDNEHRWVNNDSLPAPQNPPVGGGGAG